MNTVVNPASEQFVYQCAGPNCSQIKGRTDHWWLMWPSKVGNVSVLSLCAWDEEIMRRQAAMSVCGEECAQRLQSMFMANILEHQRGQR
jgi:hypothetical protein